MRTPVVLVTGTGGEIGHGLIARPSAAGRAGSHNSHSVNHAPLMFPIRHRDECHGDGGNQEERKRPAETRVGHAVSIRRLTEWTRAGTGRATQSPTRAT
jgi:hypothetical protein